MTLDHLIFAAPDLPDAVDQLEQRLGVGASAGGRHESLGTHNALLGLGGTRYLEIIAPDPEQPPPGMARPFGLDSLSGPVLVGWAVRCDDIAASVSSARAAGYDPGEPIAMQRTADRGASLRWRLTLNAIEGGVIPFLIDWGDAPHPSLSASAGLELHAFHLEHPEPDSLVTSLAALDADVAVVEAARPALVAVIDGPSGRQELR